MASGSKVISIMLVVSLLILIFPVLPNQNASGDLINPSALVNHNTIVISGNSDFTSANGVVSGAGTKNDPYIIENWSISASSNYGIYIASTNVYFIIRNCYIYNGNSSYQGIYLYQCDNGIIENNRILNNYYGIYMSYSDYCTIRNNTCNLSRYIGIYVYRSEYITIINNTCKQNQDGGIYNYYSDHNIIRKNRCTLNSGNGLSVSESDYTNVSSNSCDSNSNHGLTVRWSDYNTIHNNTCIYNGDSGIYMYYVNDNKILNNTIANNLDYGISSYYDSSNTFANNTIRDNIRSGLYLTYTYDNLFYNNYINNTKNYEIYKINSSYKNSWYISKTPGLNIVGGPYLGGNYWSDYTGYDTDQDRLGDTELPYGPGDIHPLIIFLPPAIRDNTPNKPTTGDFFIFNTTVNSNAGVDKVYIQYQFDQSAPENTAIFRTFGNNYRGIYTLNITVPDHAFTINYTISAKDILSKWGSYGPKVLNVIDNDKPQIIDYTSPEPVTGEDFLFDFSVKDNINVSSVHLEFWFDHGVHQNITLSEDGGFYRKNTDVPTKAKKLRYVLSAEDNSSNWAGQGLKLLYVVDNIRPDIKDNSGIPTTGDSFTFNFELTDNIEVSSAYLEYWFDKKPHKNVTLPLFPEKPIYKTTVPPDAFVLNTLVTTIDNAGNLKQLSIAKPVVDNDLPIIQELPENNPETGTLFNFNCSIFENRLLKNASLEYCFDEEEYNLQSLNYSEDKYYLEILVPINATRFSYSITAEDSELNLARINSSLWVIDVIPPEILYLSNEAPTTDDEFEVKAIAQDNIKVEVVYLEYWFDLDEHLNVSFNDTLSINAPFYAKKLNIIFTAFDSSFNVRVLKLKIDVLDNDPPEIEEQVPKPTTGDYFEFNIKINENIKIKFINLEYQFDDNEPVIINFTNAIRIFSVVAPNNSKLLTYSILALDASGNSKLIERNISVIDNDSPWIIDRSYQTGATFLFHAKVDDNIEVSDVVVSYWYENGVINTVELQYMDDIYQGKISIPDNENKMYYVILANDTSENIRITDEKEKGMSIQEQIEPLAIFEEDSYLIILLIIILIIIIGLLLVLYPYSKKKGAENDLQPIIDAEQLSPEEELPPIIPESTAPIDSPSKPLPLTPTIKEESAQPTISSTPKLASPIQSTRASISDQIPQPTVIPLLPPKQTQPTPSTDEEPPAILVDISQPSNETPIDNEEKDEGVTK